MNDSKQSMVGISLSTIGGGMVGIGVYHSFGVGGVLIFVGLALMIYSWGESA